MKFRTLNKWQNTNVTADLLYVAQLLEELLFDYSLDTYKPSAMNTSLLCKEALETIDYVSRGVFQPPNTRHVLEEFIKNLAHDKVAKALLSIDIDQTLRVLKNEQVQENELQITLQLLMADLDLQKYKNQNENLIIDALMNAAGKDILRSLIRSYITTLRNFGFHSKYLYESTLKFFYYGESPITSNDDIKDYLDLFGIQHRRYISIYRASKIFIEISDSCEVLDVQVSDTVSEYRDQIARHAFELRNSDEIYVIVKDIEAREVYSAREKSDQRIELLRTLMTLFHHKQQPNWNKECLVIDVETSSAKSVHKSLNPMHKCIDYKPAKASKYLNSLISEFSLEGDSFYKFTRSSELHSLALNSESRENQIINLWIALESLIPAHSDKAKIQRIIDSVMPFLALSYVSRLLERFLADLINWNRHLVLKTLRKINGSTSKQKLISLLVLEENDAERTSLKTEMRDFHLLRNRMHYLSESLKSPKSLKKLLDNHSMRVAWQIRRIYRARNTIVHAGITPTYTDILTENLHDYLDILMSTIVKLGSDGERINTIEQAFACIRLNYGAYIDSLNLNNDSFTFDDIEKCFIKYSI